MTDEKSERAEEDANANAGADAKADADVKDAPREAFDSKDDEAISKLLKKSFASEAPEEAAPESMLPSVQRKIRQRSKGKFYGDGWSTQQSKLNYALVAVIMLLVIAVCYMALGPTGFSAH
jgi:hypothetical protein